MKINKLIIIMFSIQMAHVNAMPGMKETLRRMAQDSQSDSKQEVEGQVAMQAMPRDGRAKSEVEILQAADQITQAIKQKIDKEEAEKKFKFFLKEFKIQVYFNFSDYWKIKQAYERRLPLREVQGAIDTYYKMQFTALYKNIYKKHYQTEAPAQVAEHFALQAYKKETSCCGPCCVIL